MTHPAEKSDAETLPLRRGLLALRMTNSSQDYNDDDSMAHWKANREAFGERAARSYASIRKAIGDGGSA